MKNKIVHPNAFAAAAEYEKKTSATVFFYQDVKKERAQNPATVYTATVYVARGKRAGQLFFLGTDGKNVYRRYITTTPIWGKTHLTESMLREAGVID